MKWFIRFLEFYVNSSIHVAFSVVGLTIVTQQKFNIFNGFDLLFFVFFATITGYNFIKYAGVAKFHHRSLTRSLKVIQVFSFFCFLLMCYFFFQLPLASIQLVVIFAGITFFYAIPLVPKIWSPVDENQNLRSISGIKIYVIALVWVGVTVLLPLSQADMFISHDVYIEAFQRFLMVMLLMIPFEIRDMKYDSIKLGTIPQKIGLKKTKRIALFLIVVLFALEFFKDEVSPLEIVIFAVISILLGLFIQYSSKDQSKYYSSFWVEGIPIYWCVLILLLK